MAYLILKATLEFPAKYADSGLFKEAVIMALSVSQRQATSVPIYIPISVAQMAQAPLVSTSPSRPVPPLSPTPCLQHFPPLVGPGREAEPGASGEVICPKCGRPGKLYEHKRGAAGLTS